MSKDGYVPLSFIANFHRLQSLTQNINFIADVSLISKSSHLFFI